MNYYQLAIDEDEYETAQEARDAEKYRARELRGLRSDSRPKHVRTREIKQQALVNRANSAIRAV